MFVVATTTVLTTDYHYYRLLNLMVCLNTFKTIKAVVRFTELRVLYKYSLVNLIDDGLNSLILILTQFEFGK